MLRSCHKAISPSEYVFLALPLVGDADYIFVDIKQTVGLQAVEPIKIKKGSVNQVVTLMTHVMEEVQERDAGVRGGALHTKKTDGAQPATMAR